MLSGTVLFLLSYVMIFFGFLLKYKISGIKEQLPNANLIPLNVKAPTYFAPTLCATNANPHMAAANKRSKLDFNSSFFIIPPFYCQLS